MTLTTIFIITGSIALILTLIVGLILKQQKSWLMTYVQNFCGAFFIFSGLVKAVDPLGTAYKMNDYFAEFEYVFEPTWFSFLAPIFPWLSNHTVGFAVFMIVLEIVLGVMLIMGNRPKFTSWLFLAIVIFFTILTGFTFLTGYVPAEVNFFQFGKWGPYVESNMKVQDCGCFGDFIKLKPKVSFFKDLILLVPALFMIFKFKDMHQIFNKTTRFGVAGLSTVAFLIYCFSNFVWDIPHADFRPFKKMADVKNQKEQELRDFSDVSILGFVFENEKTGKVVEVLDPNYTTAIAQYPKTDGWKFKDQIQSEPKLKKLSKIGEYAIQNFDGDEITDDLLNHEGVSVMIVSYKLEGDAVKSTRMVRDTSFVKDTIQISQDSFQIVKNVGEITERKEDYTSMTWDDDFIDNYKNKITPFVKAARAKGLRTYGVYGGASKESVSQLMDDSGAGLEIFSADDILLKTIVRSNPGVVLWKDGKILNKWHIKKLPNFSEVSY